MFRNELWTSLLHCYILFQGFSYIFYSFHLLRNRNGFIKKKDECFIVSFRFSLFCNEHILNFSSCFRDFPLYLIGFICYETEMGLWKKNAWLRKVSVSLLHYVTPCLVTSTDQGVWTVSSCFVTNETNETDHQWELLLVCFICFILFQSILEYSLYILIVTSVSVTEKKTCPKKTCVVFVQYMHLSVKIFKRLLLWSRWANFAQISYGASLGWGNEKLLKWSQSVDQDGRHVHIW